MQDNFFLYSLQGTQAYLEPSQMFIMEFLCENIKLLTIFVKKFHHRFLTEF